MRTLIFFAFFLPAIAIAGIYKWIDEEGTIHYTQQAPDLKDSELISPSGIKPADDEEEKKERDSHWETFKKEETPADAPLSEENRAIKDENCRRAKSNLDQLTKSPAGRPMRDKEGNIFVIPLEERNQKIEEAKRQIEKNCD